MDDPRDNEDGAPATGFKAQVEYFAETFILNARDLRQTYQDQPESMKAYFNAYAKAVPDMNSVLGAVGIKLIP